MPGSRKEGKPRIKEWFDNHTDIKSIVDVGAGSATYPKLLGKDKYKWIAIEIWGPYIEQWNLKEYYSDIIIADIKHVILPEADCIIFGDILEHMAKEDALKVLKKAQKKFKHILVSIPVMPNGELYPAAIHYGNKFEAHISGWTFPEVHALDNWELEVEIKNIGIFAK